MKAARKNRSGLRLGIISGVILVCATLIAIPFFNANGEERKFKEMSNVLRSTFSGLQSVDTSSSWRYKESCQDIYSGSFPTGEITCKIELRLQKSVSSASAVKDLHDAYYKVITNDPNLLPSGQLSLSPNNSFGKKFVVSAAEARYTIKDLKDITCRYTLALGQQNENSFNFSLGNPIETPSGTIYITFLCSGKAVNYWYVKL